MKKIYLDYAATTPVDERVKEKILPYLSHHFANPSSLHSFGAQAREAVDEARSKVANFLRAEEREIIFTSSATVSNNLAILGVLKKYDNPHIITTPIEHKAVLKPIEDSKAEVSYLPINKSGVVEVEELKKLLKENTVLLTVGYVNSEVGTVQPLGEISEIIRDFNKERKEPVLFHTDAVQAVNYLSCNVKEIGVDMLTLSGHKIYGPKGAGVLFVKEGISLEPLFSGANQEGGIFPGTENVLSIAGLGFALDLINGEEEERVKMLRDKVIEVAVGSEYGGILNGEREKRVSNNANLSFPGVEGESLLFALDREGIAVSTGSACASSSLSPSYVLTSMGVSPVNAHGSIRVSLGRFTTQEEIDYFLEKLLLVIKKLRKISGR